MNLPALTRTPAPGEIPAKYIWGPKWCLARLMNLSGCHPSLCLSEPLQFSLLSRKPSVLTRHQLIGGFTWPQDQLSPQGYNLLQMRTPNFPRTLHSAWWCWERHGDRDNRPKMESLMLSVMSVNQDFISNLTTISASPSNVILNQ